MLKHPWIVFLSLCVLGAVFQAVCGTIPDITTLCPYNKFCTSMPTEVQKPDVSHLTPCCKECSCYQDCQLFENCCPDKELTQSTNNKKYPCTKIDEYFNKQRQIHTTVNLELSYQMIDDCPNAFLDLAYPRCSTITELEDCVIVSDTNTDVVYKNKHCAMCNGIEDFVEWQLLTECGYEEPDNFTIKEWHSFILEYCEITSVPPDPSAGFLYRCTDEENIIKECNKTGRWKTFNQEIKTACELGNSTQTYTYERVDEKEKYYKNVYCMICNTYQEEILSGLCEKELIPTKERSTVALSVIVNFKFQIEENEDIQGKCHQSQIWDPFNEVCLVVKCPFTTISYQGKCEDVLTYLPGLSYLIIFHLKSDAPVYSYETLELLDQMITNFVQNPDCLKCGSSLEMVTDRSLYLRYPVDAQKTCTKEYLLSKVKKIYERSPISVSLVTGENITMTLMLNFKTPSLQDTLYMTGYFCKTYTHVNQAMIDKCPRIPIASLDFNRTISYISTERNGTLCVDEYFKIMGSLSNNHGTAHMHITMSILMAFNCIYSVYCKYKH